MKQEEKLLSELSFTTLENITTEIEIIDNDTFYEVLITSSTNILDQAYYQVYLYDEVNDYWYFSTFDSAQLLQNASGFSASFIIDKPIEETYYIEIVLQSTTNYEYQKILSRIES